MEQEQQQNQQPRLKLKLKLNSNDTPNQVPSSSLDKNKGTNANKLEKKVSDIQNNSQVQKQTVPIGSNFYEEAEPGEIVRPQNMPQKKPNPIPIQSNLIPKMYLL